MKLHISDTKVSGSGFEAVDSFKIEMNAKAFKVLSDTLYKNKIGSIVRELSCNAFDAHVASGNADKPFEIHLPDAFEPYFSIRDFGTGISPEDIKSIYTSYFTSTKDDSNESVGAFGLGSKTPFAYTDAFTVISIHNGVKTMYNAHMNAGLPAIVAYGKPEPTDEPDGLEVNVSVEAVDYSAFAEAVTRQLKFFEVKPTVLNGSVTWTEYTPTLQVEGFMYYSIENAQYRYGQPRHHLAALFLKQGPVAYPVDFDIIDQYLNSNGIKQSDFYKFLSNNSRMYNRGMIIDMPIGTVEVTASREGISYSDVTIRNILTKIDAISSVISTDVVRMLTASYAESNAAFVTAWYSLEQYFRSSVNPAIFNTQFKKFDFSKSQPFLRVPNAAIGLECRRYDVAGYAKPKLSGNNVITEDDTVWTMFSNIVQNDKTVYVKDVNTSFVARVNNDNTSNMFYLVTLPDTMTIEQFKKWTTGVTVKLVSELEEVTSSRKRTGNGGRSITGGQNRVFFEVNITAIKRGVVGNGMTLYAAGCEQVFAESLDDAIQEDEKFVYITTLNNKVDNAPENHPFGNDGDGHDKLALFSQWLDGEGYRIVGLAKGDIKKAEETGQFITMGDAWKKYHKTFLQGVWSIFEKVALTDYYERARKAMFSTFTWSAECSEVGYDMLKEMGFTEELDAALDFIRDSVDTYNETHNPAIRSFIESFMGEKRVKLYDYFRETYLSGGYRATSNSFEEMEYDMTRAGFKWPVSVSKFFDEYKKVMFDNIDRVLLKAFHSGYQSPYNVLNVLTIGNPFPNSKQPYIVDKETIVTKLGEKMGFGG